MSGQDDFLEGFRNKIGKKKSNEIDNEQKEEESNSNNPVKSRAKEIEDKIKNNSQYESKEDGPRVSHFLKKNIYAGKFFGSSSNNNNSEASLHQSKSIPDNVTPKSQKGAETIADIVANPDNFFTYTSDNQNSDLYEDEINPQRYNTENNNKQSTTTNVNDNNDYDTELNIEDTYQKAGRTSTNKVKILSHLKQKLKQEEQTTGNIDVRPRLSVRDMIQNNEKRLQQINSEKSEEERRSNQRLQNKEIWQNRMREIAEFIRIEKEEGETAQEFYDSNNEYLKDFGITNYKDFLSIQELIQFYEKGLIKPENLTAKGQRNTAGVKSKATGLNISEIEEEKEDENQMTSKKDFYQSIKQFEKTNNLNVHIDKTIKPLKNIEITSSSRMTYTSKPRNFNLITKVIKLPDNLSYKGKEKELLLSINKEQTLKLSPKEKKPFTKQTSNLLYQSIPQRKQYQNNSLVIYLASNNTISLSKIKQKETNANIFEHNYSCSYYNQVKTHKEKIVKQSNIQIQSTKKAQNKILNLSSQSQVISNEVIMKQNKKQYHNKELSHIKKEVNILFKPSYIRELKIMMECYDEVIHDKGRYKELYIQNVLKIFYNGKQKSTNYEMQSYQGDAAVYGRIKPIAIASKIINIGYFPDKRSQSSNEIVNIPFSSIAGSRNNQKNILTDREYNDSTKIPENMDSTTPKRVKATQHQPTRSNHYELREEEVIELQLKNHELVKETRPTLDKILSSNIRNTLYQKNIISSLDLINVMKYSLNSNIPFDPSFLDVLCISCYECVKLEDMDSHSNYCVIKLESYQDNQYDQDYNSRIFKLHESLKAKKNEIIRTNNLKLISFYNKLLQVIYDILINNNSIEELDKSISTITDMINNELNSIDDSFHFYFLMFTQRLSQLVYMKLKDMEKILVMIQKNDDESDEDYGQEEEMDPEEIKYVKMQLSSLESKQQQAQLELKQWKKEAKKLDYNLRRPMRNNNEILSDIVSDINSRAESLDVMTTFTGQGSEMNDYFDIDNENNPDDFTEEDQKKYFLALGLGVKFKYSDKIKDSVSIADLYEKAKNQNITIGEYQNFIIKELLPSGIVNANSNANANVVNK